MILIRVILILDRKSRRSVQYCSATMYMTIYSRIKFRIQPYPDSRSSYSTAALNLLVWLQYLLPTKFSTRVGTTRSKAPPVENLQLEAAGQPGGWRLETAAVYTLIR